MSKVYGCVKCPLLNNKFLIRFHFLNMLVKTRICINIHGLIINLTIKLVSFSKVSVG